MGEHSNCGNCGEYVGQVPMPIRRRVCYIDPCIAPIVAALNAANIATVASCCGHGKRPGLISLEDGRELTITEPAEPTPDRGGRDSP
jgi:hypothetical protein